MAKKKMRMYQTFKAAVFKPIMVDGKEIPVVDIINGHLVINDDFCDLRTIKERYNPETKKLSPSMVDCIMNAESVLALHYGRCIVSKPLVAGVPAEAPAETSIAEHNTLYDFITVDCSGGNDNDPDTKRIKELLCLDGLHMPLSKLEDVGYIPHSEVEIVEIDGVKYVRYRAAMQSASENRQCKLTMTTYAWESFAKTISGDALYLYKPTQTAQKAIARQGLGKTNGNVVKDFDFTFAVVPDLETEITFPARCFNDKENVITAGDITATKVATDGCGFILPSKARELADKLGLSYLPSAFQVRYGQIKGILLVFDFHEYSSGIINEDILFTGSMMKSDFDTNKAQFLVANVSKPPRSYCEWNYQMLTTINSSLSFDDILPYAENIREHMEKALTSPEAALKFLGIVSDISALSGGDDESGGSREGHSNNKGGGHDCVDKVSAVIQANPQLAMNIRWVKQSIKRRIDLVSKKMLFGKIPMPQSGVSIMAPDPLAYFNRLRVYGDGSYGFADDNGGILTVPIYEQVKELSAGEFRHGDYEGCLLATRNPLTHHAQIRKLKCVNHASSSRWYKHLEQVVVFNAHDETVLGMGGADHDGDMCIHTKLFTDKFRQADYIIYNGNDTGDKAEKVVLTEEVVQRGILANLQPNMLGIICNINTRCLELMNDPIALQKFVALAGYAKSGSFGIMDTPQMPYKPKFADMPTAMAYLEKLNHKLTTLSELEVDRPKTGYANRFYANQQEYTLPFAPYWFVNIKEQLHKYQNRQPESLYTNRLGESVRALSRSFDDGKLVKMITDTLKSSSRGKDGNSGGGNSKSGKAIDSKDTNCRDKNSGKWVQRTIEMMADGDSIMANIQRFVQEQILDMDIDESNCFSITESLKDASILDTSEAERVTDAVRRVYKSYCREIAGNIRAMREGYISQEDFDNAFENILEVSDDALRAISSDRVALAYSAYTLSLENSYGSQSFPFLVVLDGMCALLNDVRTTDFYEINLRMEIPHNLAHLLNEAVHEVVHIIVYNCKLRLPESIDASKTYFGNVPLANGSYEIHRDLKGSISLIVPKAAPKNKLNIVPFNDDAAFSLKVSYKSSELAYENKNGEYVTQLMAGNPVTFKIATIAGNTQYFVYAGDTWVGTVFDDQAKSNGWVLRKEIVKSLIGKEYELVNIPRTGVKANSNSFTTGTGTMRSAQILTFQKAVQQAKPVTERIPLVV